jgi:hypothetical protein
MLIILCFYHGGDRLGTDKPLQTTPSNLITNGLRPSGFLSLSCI